MLPVYVVLPKFLCQSLFQIFVEMSLLTIVFVVFYDVYVLCNWCWVLSEATFAGT